MLASEALRQAIRAYGSERQVARDAGVPQPVVNRFVTGKRDLYLATVDKLAARLGLELRPKRKK